MSELGELLSVRGSWAWKVQEPYLESLVSSGSPRKEAKAGFFGAVKQEDGDQIPALAAV